MTYDEVLSRLFSHADESYRAFHKRLLNNDAIRVIGVRMPVLRALAREWKGEFSVLAAFPDEYYEVTLLKCLIADMLPYGSFVPAADMLVEKLDNWATCDSFRAPCLDGNREAYLPYLETYLSDGREFVVRYALVTLLKHYVRREYLPLIFRSVRMCTDAQYYVCMGAAWLTAEVLAHFFEEGYAFLQEEGLSPRLRALAVRKARESFRLTREQKDRLSALKQSFAAKSLP